MNEHAPTPAAPEGAATPLPPTPLDPSRPRLLRLKLVGLIIFVIWLPFDLWSKDYMQDKLGLVDGQPRSAHEIDVIPGFLAWQGTWNPGVTFGLAPGRPTSSWPSPAWRPWA